MSFFDFVVIKLNEASASSIDYKAISSFVSSVRDNDDLPTEELLAVWIANMIDNGLLLASRKRYVSKLSAIYKEYCNQNGVDGNPFEKVKRLRDCETGTSSKEIQTENALLTKVFSALMRDAKSYSGLSVFLYLLFDASSEMEKAISLKVNEYHPIFSQLDDIINTSTFHHRRKYVFDLGQSRKRMPQMVKEVSGDIRDYLLSKGIKLSEPFTAKTIVSLWIAKAREIGIKLADIKSVLTIIPPEYDYLGLVKGSDLSDERRLLIKKKVAEAFFPTDKRWYAMKLRRNASFDDVQHLIKTELPDCFEKAIFFYPIKKFTKRVGRKIISESMPYIPDIVFFKLQHSYLRGLDHVVRRENLGWVFRQVNLPDSDYAVIDNRGMQIFQKAIGELSSDMKVELTRESPIEIGRKVRITGGIMAGYNGMIYDIKDSGRDSVRQIYIKLSADYSIKAELKIEEYFVEPIDHYVS